MNLEILKNPIKNNEINEDIEIKDIQFDNEYFWFYFLGTAFPNGYSEKNDMAVGEMIEQIFDTDNDKALSWINNFTGYYEGVMDESDGYLENPKFFSLELAQNILLRIEFHPGDTIYYLNDIQIGCTGPHWQVYCLTWNELIKISNNTSYTNYVFLLLLPITAITKEDSLDKIREFIIEKFNALKCMSHDMDEELAVAIIEGIFIEEGFREEKDIGIVCKNNYSMRFPNKDNL